MGGDFRDLFTITAEASAALTGLLFVATSVIPRRRVFTVSPVIQQVRAAAALLSFVNPLAVSLFALVPGTNVGYPAAIVGVIGLLFTFASGRSILRAVPGTVQRIRQLFLVAALLVAFCYEIGAGITLISKPSDTNALQTLGYVLVALVLAGVARAWELVGERDTGIFASLAILTGHEPDVVEDLPHPGAVAGEERHQGEDEQPSDHQEPEAR
ncbi:MAG TPA: hypothetical protein VEL03_13760 [Streptosporangiaceae bacterium]|nr:hypothetical protein [Streptosporangiaceae bacterium]